MRRTTSGKRRRRRRGAFNGDFDSFDEDGNVIPTTLLPTECDGSGNCFEGSGDSFDDASAEDYDESEQV